MSTSLLTTKLYIPPVRPELVSRPRLIERLNAGLRRKLTLVSAPAGFGKTTLLSEWVSSCDRAVAWVSLDERDNDPARFLAYFIAALQQIEEGVGQGTLGALQSPGLAKANTSPPMEESLTALINQINAIPDTLVLVLDDYHAITAQPIHDALTFLIDHLPTNMHLVIATRADPPLPFARLRGRGQLTELRQADLRFTPDEVGEFLYRAMSLEVSGDDVAALTARTEGWIAGLQMAALALQAHISTQGQDDTASFIQGFTGSSRYVLDYLVEEVLQRQPEGIQNFLLQTSILDRLTGPLCDAVIAGQPIGKLADRQTDRSPVRPLADSLTRRFADSSSREMLEYLERANLFVVPLDDRREWYRYHRLFADLLRRRLQQVQPDQVPILHGRASVWYEQNGRMDAAIEHALSAGDFEWAARLIERAAEPVMLRSEVATLQSWIEALPDRLVRAWPRLCVYHAIALVLSGHPLEVAEARLQDAVEADTAERVAGEVSTFRALIAAYRGELRQSLELSHRALELLPEDSLFFRSFVAGYLGLAYLYRGDVAAARQAFDEAVRIGQQVGNVTNTVLALCHLADLSALQGRLREARSIYEQAAGLAVDGQGRRQPIAGIALMGLGRILREQDELEAAARLLKESIELIEKWGEVGAIGAHVGLALVRHAQGDVEGTRQAIQTAEQLAMKFDAMEMDDIYVGAYKARLCAAQGDLEAAARWAEESGLEKSASLEELQKAAAGASLPLLRVYEYVALAHVRIAQGRPDEALSLLKPLLRATENAGWTALVLQILTPQALALQAQGDVDGAMVTLERALSLAEPEGFVRVFADVGEPMIDLLRQAAARGMASDYAGRLLAAFGAGAGEQERTPPPPLIEPLSERELEVLRLLTTHLSSTEMAEELVLSVNTVRSHIKNIYGKLNVHSRADAVQRAEELGLL